MTRSIRLDRHAGRRAPRLRAGPALALTAAWTAAALAACAAVHAEVPPDGGLAEPPRWRPDAAAGETGTSTAASAAAGDTARVWIDPTSRDSVANAYLGVFVPQSGIAAGWTGALGSCTSGTTAAAYHAATIERVNVYRALAGLPGNVTAMPAGAVQGAQDAALMFTANGQISHAPPTSWLCYTAAGAGAAAASNISLGLAGPEAVVTYMDDYGSGNGMVGHRRWILYPPQAQMASGSVDGADGWPSNALRVIGGFGARPDTPAGVAWPPPGYVPWQLLPSVSNRWSYSWPGANFANARVTMTRNGQTLGAVAYEPLANDVGYGDNTLVWLPQGVNYGQPAGDTVYRVTIDGASGNGIPASLSYAVMVFHPEARPERVFGNGFDG